MIARRRNRGKSEQDVEDEVTNGDRMRRLTTTPSPASVRVRFLYTKLQWETSEKRPTYGPGIRLIGLPVLYRTLVSHDINDHMLPIWQPPKTR